MAISVPLPSGPRRLDHRHAPTGRGPAGGHWLVSRRVRGEPEVDDVSMSDRPGSEVHITHLENLEPQRVRTQRHSDGSERSVWDRYFVISRDPTFVSLHTRWDPDVIVHRHGHMGH